jgi:hypothetical protein
MRCVIEISVVSALVLSPICAIAQTTTQGSTQLPPLIQIPSGRIPIDIARKVKPIPTCDISPYSATAYMYGPWTISQGWTVSTTYGKVLVDGDNFSVLFPNHWTYAGIYLTLTGPSQSWLLPFDELYAKFSLAELTAHGVTILKSDKNLAVCYIRVRNPRGALQPGVVSSIGGKYFDISNLNLWRSLENGIPGYYYDVEVFSFSDAGMSKVQEFRINFNLCSTTTATSCP